MSHSRSRNPTEYTGSRRVPRGAVRFASLRAGQHFRTLDASGDPSMAVLYARIPELPRGGVRYNALGWGLHGDGRQGRRYYAFSHTALVLPDTVSVPLDPDDDEDHFDPTRTPGPAQGIFDPNLDDVW